MHIGPYLLLYTRSSCRVLHRRFHGILPPPGCRNTWQAMLCFPLLRSGVLLVDLHGSRPMSYTSGLPSLLWIEHCSTAHRGFQQACSALCSRIASILLPFTPYMLLERGEKSRFAVLELHATVHSLSVQNYTLKMKRWCFYKEILMLYNSHELKSAKHF